ncbi:MAG: hypothetical protein ACJ0BN_15085 [Limisphaerales bacterium]|nr:hypothetical protein [Pedosphaera sp.]HCP36656.1 hypothetical protein [Verrucomicrobiales bacterium]
MPSKKAGPTCFSHLPLKAAPHLPLQLHYFRLRWIALVMLDRHYSHSESGLRLNSMQAMSWRGTQLQGDDRFAWDYFS